MSAYQLQIGVYNALNADATLGGLIQGIYDNPTQVADPSDNSAFPFVTLSDFTSVPWDTDTEKGFDADVTIHVWSRAHHSLEAKQIQDAIYDVLHRGTISITNHAFIACDYITQTVERDPDGVTRHGIQEFRIVYEEA